MLNKTISKKQFLIEQNNMREDFKKIIEESGNNLHIYTADLLENMGWDVDLSSYYYDDTASKPREIDIIAQRKVQVINSPEEKLLGEFKLFLFIECKYFKNELSFRMRRNREKESKEAMIIEGIKSVDGWDKESLLEEEGLFREHHYLKERFIGKLYDSFPKEQEAVFNALTQPIKSLTFFKERRLEKGMYYPMVVYSGIEGIYDIKREKADLDKLEPKKELIFGLNYSYRSVVDNKLKTNLFYIDFIHQERLGDFIEEVIRKESSELRQYLFWKSKMGK